MVLERKSRQDFKNTIESYLTQYLEKLEEGHSENKINAFEHKPLDEKGNLLVDIVEYVEIDESTYSEEELEEAEQTILEGKYVPHFLGAGAATRFGKGPLFLLTSTQICPIKGKKFLDLKLGERLFLSYRYYLERLSEKYNKNIEEILKKQKIILHVNEQIKDEIEKLIYEKNWFGFSPENFILVIQETYPSYESRGGNLVETSEKYPYGHGHTLLQLGFRNEGYFLNENNDKIILSETVLDYIEKKGGEVLCVHRVNDLYRYSLNPICKYKLCHSLKEFNSGTKLGIELVANPENQKGGKWLMWKNNPENSFLLETLNAKDNDWDRVFSELENKHHQQTGEGIPYNAFRNIYSIKSLNEILHLGLKPSLRVRGDKLTLEFVTGDITIHSDAKASAFHFKNEEISDFKSPSQIKDFFNVVENQESDLFFRDLAKQYISKFE